MTQRNPHAFCRLTQYGPCIICSQPTCIHFDAEANAQVISALRAPIDGRPRLSQLGPSWTGLIIVIVCAALMAIIIGRSIFH